MCTNCDPQPLDEQPQPPAETRGGDRLADITVPGQMSLPFPGASEDGLHGSCACCDPYCGNEDE